MSEPKSCVCHPKTWHECSALSASHVTDGSAFALLPIAWELSDIQQQLRTLEKNNKLIKKEEAKEAAKETSAAKDAAKETKKSEIDNKKQKKITGFNVCEKMSNELCDFMKLPHNSVSPRTTITKYITEYIHNNKLQDTTERKNIQMDHQLKLLLAV